MVHFLSQLGFTAITRPRLCSAKSHQNVTNTIEGSGI